MNGFSMAMKTNVSILFGPPCNVRIIGTRATCPVGMHGQEKPVVIHFSRKMDDLGAIWNGDVPRKAAVINSPPNGRYLGM